MTAGDETAGRADARRRARSADRPAPLVAVVVINWNGPDDTLNAHASLIASRFANWRLVIVDNASIDDSVARLSGLGEKVVLVESARNLGFAGGCNLGIATSRKLGANYVFLLNNDAWVTPDTLGHLVEAAQSLGDRAAIGAVVRYADGSPQFHGTVKSRWGHSIWLQPSEERLRASPDLIPTDFIMGAALLMPMAAIDAVGDFDERFFLNYEEMDWCYRADKRGFACYVLKVATAYHKGSASLGSLDSPLQTYFRSRNELLFLEKHGALVPWSWAFGRIVRRLGGRLFRAMKREESALASAEILFLALRDYLMRRFGDCPDRIRELARASLIAQSASPAAKT